VSKIISLSLLVAGCALMTPGYAQVSTALSEQILECTVLQQDADRLGCFDNLAQQLTPTPEVVETPEIAVATESVSAAAAVAVATTATLATDSPDDAEMPATNVSEAESAAEPMAEQAELAVEALSEEQVALGEFGMNAELASKQPDRKAEEALREISAKVVEVYKRGYGEHVVTLDNGQVWTEKRNEDGLRIRVGDTVRIKRSSFGGYRIVGSGNRSSPAKRIE